MFLNLLIYSTATLITQKIEFCGLTYSKTYLPLLRLVIMSNYNNNKMLYLKISSISNNYKEWRIYLNLNTFPLHYKYMNWLQLKRQKILFKILFQSVVMLIKSNFNLNLKKCAFICKEKCRLFFKIINYKRENLNLFALILKHCNTLKTLKTRIFSIDPNLQRVQYNFSILVLIFMNFTVFFGLKSHLLIIL